MPPKANEFDREMQVLESEMKRLEAEYNMFFAGRLPRLPWETRARVEALVKRHDRSQTHNTAQRFRFGTLQARYASFCELWERALKAKEEGRQPGRQRKQPEAAEKHADSAEKHADSAEKHAEAATEQLKRDHVVAVASFKDPMKESDRLMALYERLSEARNVSGEQQIPYHRFAEVVRAQVNKLGGGEAEVAFKVAMKDGKVTLTAKMLKGGG